MKGSLDPIRSNPSGLIYWTRVLLALFASILCIVLNLKGLRGITLGLTLYLVSYYLIRYGYRIKPEEVGGISKIFTIGIGAYFLLWIVSWTVLYTYFI